MRLRFAGRGPHTWMLIGLMSLFLACGDDEDPAPTEPGNGMQQPGDDGEDLAAAQAQAAELFGMLQPVMTEAFLKLALGGGTIEGDGGGTITVADNEMVMEDFSPDGQFFLNGELTFDGEAEPPTLKGDLVATGEAFEAPLDINLDMTVDVATQTYGGKVTVGGVEYDIAVLLEGMA